MIWYIKILFTWVSIIWFLIIKPIDQKHCYKCKFFTLIRLTSNFDNSQATKTFSKVSFRIKSTIIRLLKFSIGELKLFHSMKNQLLCKASPFWQFIIFQCCIKFYLNKISPAVQNLIQLRKMKICRNVKHL